MRLSPPLSKSAHDREVKKAPRAPNLSKPLFLPDRTLPPTEKPTPLPQMIERLQNHSALRANPFPKLRIWLADFPYLHSSIQLEADHLGDLMRISVRSSVWISQRKHILRFSRGHKKVPDASRIDTLFQQLVPLLQSN